MEKRSPPYTIGILVNNIGDFVYSVCKGTAFAAEQLGCHSRVFGISPIIHDQSVSTHDSGIYEVDDASLQKTLNLIEQFNVDALVINTDVVDFTNKRVLSNFVSERPHMPVATIATHLYGASLIKTDNYKSSMSAVEHIILQHGRREIAYITAPLDNEEGRERFRAYKDALAEHGIPYNPDLVAHGDWFVPAGENAVKLFLDERKVSFNALIGANDNMVSGAIDELTRRNISVPGDVDVFGYDNSIFAESYGFSSVSQSYFEMARIAVNELYHQLERNKFEHKVIPTPGPLIIKHNCGCSRRRINIQVIDDKYEDSEECLNRLVESKKNLEFRSPEQKKIFFEDLSFFWRELCQALRLYHQKPNLLRRLKKTYAKMLQREVLHNMTIPSWQTIMVELQESCRKIDIRAEELGEFFSDIQKLTIDAVERSIKQNQLRTEELAYEVVILGQRLMASESLDLIGSIYLEFMQTFDAKFAYLSIFPEEERISGAIRSTNLISKMDNNDQEYFHSGTCNLPLANIKDLLPVSLDGENKTTHFVVIPIGKNKDMYGFCVSDISQDAQHWHLYRSLQIYISQALINIERLQLIRRSESDARKASLAKSEFLSRMTHELRTPMNGVIGMTSLLLDTELSEEQQDFVTTIRNSGDTLLSLISEILDYSKLEADRLTLEYSNFNLTNCIEDAVDLVAATAASKNIALSYIINPDVPVWINQDITRVRQVLANLLSNSVKFTKQGEISVSVSLISLGPQGEKIEIRVCDTGIGIPEEKIRQLFQPFVQADASIHREYGGTGLGLVISKKISSIMGGDLLIEESGKNGTIFCFSFKFQPVDRQYKLNPWEKPFDLNQQDLPTIHFISEIGTHRRIIEQACCLWKIELSELGFENFKSQIGLAEFSSPQNHCVIFDIDRDSENWQPTIIKFAEDNPSFQVVCFVNLGFNNKLLNVKPNISIIRKPIRPRVLFYALNDYWSKEKVNQRNTITSEVEADFARRFPLTILLAEDNIVNQKVATAILDRCGYRIDVVANGKEAVSALKHRSYDVILMDVFMPEMDGTTATEVIRKEFPAAQQPYIIAITANVMAGERERLLQIGMDDYVSKPINVKELLNSLSKAK